jgi:chromate transporter
VLGGIAGLALLRSAAAPIDHVIMPLTLGRGAGGIALFVIFVLLIALPILAAETDIRTIALADSFYRSGALVFGGGHVVLPLLQAEVVPPGWVTNDQFLAGYGAAQAVPGPLFTFAAYLGSAAGRSPPCALSPCSCPRSCLSSARCRSGRNSGASCGRNRRCAA